MCQIFRVTILVFASRASASKRACRLPVAAVCDRRTYGARDSARARTDEKKEKRTVDSRNLDVSRANPINPTVIDHLQKNKKDSPERVLHVFCSIKNLRR